MKFTSWNIGWCLCFGLLATLIVVGNLLIIWIFRKRRLRKRAHFVLISLTVADFLVGLVSVPLYIAVHTVQPYVLLWYITELSDNFYCYCLRLRACRYFLGENLRDRLAFSS